MTQRIVVIEYYWTAKKLFAFGIRSDLQQPLVAEIPVDVQELQERIRASSGTKLADQVHVVVRWEELERVVEPIGRWSSPDDVVCIVPAGALFYVPLHAVWVNGGEPLIVRNPVSYAPSASALRYCLRRRRARSGLPRATVFGTRKAICPRRASSPRSSPGPSAFPRGSGTTSRANVGSRRWLRATSCISPDMLNSIPPILSHRV